MLFQQELGRCRGSLRVRRQNKAEGLHYFCNAEELRPQGASLSIDSIHKTISTILKEGQHQLTARGFALSYLILFSCKGLVL